MDRDELGKIQISNDFEVGLSGERTKNGTERFVFVIQSDGSPSARNPDAEPDEGEKENTGKEEFWASHEESR